jgi:hypothetical protein
MTGSLADLVEFPNPLVVFGGLFGLALAGTVSGVVSYGSARVQQARVDAARRDLFG